MSDTKRIGQTMRAILVALYARRDAVTTTAELARLIEASESATRHSLARMRAYGLVTDLGAKASRSWVMTESGWDTLSALWAKEGGAAGA